RRCSLPPPPRTPPTHPLARHHTRPWKSCLERKDEDFPSGRLRPLASRHPYWGVWVPEGH
ncbi:Basic leucine zipper 23, partial [Dissostichus eleginoides]